MKQITVRIKDNDHKALRMKLLEENQTVQGWFEEQVKNYLREECPE